MQLNRAQKRQMIRHLNKPSTIKAIGERMEKAEHDINNARRMSLFNTKNYIIAILIATAIVTAMFIV